MLQSAFKNVILPMPGVYIHIPFCKQACHYCDFHFSTNLKLKNQMIEAIHMEMQMRQQYLSDPIQSIYFGGGTPSILNADELHSLIGSASKYFEFDEEVEITLEANPDDLDIEKLQAFKTAGVNRLSIGIQSFDDSTLSIMNRSHTSDQALESLNAARAAGFTSISTDLIFAVPPEDSSLTRFQDDLNRLLVFQPEHISLYSLTIEPKTAFFHQVNKGELKPVSEESNLEQYEYAVDQLTQAGYDHYEVSNFSLPELYSRHNSSYWKGAHYLGLGPGAHSFNQQTRSFNIRNNAKYIETISSGELPLETEQLSASQQCNEYVLTRIRTKWGIDSETVRVNWGYDLMSENKSLIEELISNDHAHFSNGVFHLTSKGFNIADEIALQFFREE